MTEVVPDMKFCTQCETDKPVDQFYKIHKAGWKVVYCNACVAINMAAWRKQR